MSELIGLLVRLVLAVVFLILAAPVAVLIIVWRDAKGLAAAVDKWMNL